MVPPRWSWWSVSTLAPGRRRSPHFVPSLLGWAGEQKAQHYAGCRTKLCPSPGRLFQIFNLRRFPNTYLSTITLVNDFFFFPQGQRKETIISLFMAPSNRLEDSCWGCHHHAPLVAPLHLAFPLPTLPFLFPPCTNPNLYPFFSSCFAAVQPFAFACPTSLVAHGARSWIQAPQALRTSAQGNKCVPLVFSIQGNDEISPVFRALAHTKILMR